MAPSVGGTTCFCCCCAYALCNALGSQFAALVKAQLRPDLDVFVEWSNEVWHTGFPGGQYAQLEGLRLNFSKDADEARLCYYAERTKLMAQVCCGHWCGAFSCQQRLECGSDADPGGAAARMNKSAA